MVVVQSRSKRKPTGGRYTNSNPKRTHQRGRHPSLTKLEEEKRTRTNRTKGGNSKTRLLQSDKANVTDPKTKKTTVLDIEGVVENPANRHFVRRNIITKGTIIATKNGKARVMNRPGQDGVINAALTGE